MKITAKIKDLSEQVARLSRIPGNKGLQGNTLRLTCDIAGLTMQRSTGECLASVTAEAEVETETENPVDVGFDRLLTILQNLPGENATLTIEKEALMIRSGKAVQKLPLVSGEEWQEMSKPEMDYTQVDGPGLLTAIGACVKATAKDTNKATLMGVYFYKIDDAVWCIASDVKRLHACKTELEDLEAAISTDACTALATIAGKSDFQMGATDSAICFIGEDFEILLPLMAERMRIDAFKRAMYPDDQQPLFTLETAPTIQALKFAEQSSDDGSIFIEPVKGGISVHARKNSGDEGSMKVECKHAMKEPLRIPAQQLIEALDAYGEESVEMFNTANLVTAQTKSGQRIVTICKMKVA
jgi:DNA polymerase III sliding clamp (beta) subunit (PCNA family)